MRKLILITTALLLSTMSTATYATESHPKMNHGTHGAMSSEDQHNDMNQMKSYKHSATADNIQADFEVMSLASMNMKDPEGNTHHIMVKFSTTDQKQPIDKVVSKIKVIAPDDKEQTTPLKDYGGILAANFTFKETGKYGVICAFKINDKKHVVKFWYEHHDM